MKKKLNNVVTRLIGLVILLVAIAVALLYERQPPDEQVAKVVRPIASAIVGSAVERPPLYFPGTVGADAQVDLSFEVPGRIVEFPAVRGREVAKGELLAALDPSDFENQLKNAEADLERAQSSLARVERALQSQAVSQEDYSRAVSERNKAAAALAIRQKALEDTRLTARFDGVVAQTFAEQYDTVAAGKPVLRLQGADALTLTVSIPQEYMLLATKERLESMDIHVEFDWIPGVKMSAELKDFSASADPVTRTYQATFYIDRPEDVLLLPDVAGTLVVRRAPPPEDEQSVWLPSDAVGYDQGGEPFVWLLEPLAGTDGHFKTVRRNIVLGERAGDMIAARAGLERGQRIATAGINILTKGRIVKLAEPKSSGGGGQ